MKPIAHTKNSQGKQQDLVEHLMQVAELASIFAKPLGASELVYHAGLLHDIGKFNPEFQRYLLDAEKGIKGRGPDHKGAGAVHAQQMELSPLSFLIHGHHGGLRDGSELRDFLAKRKKDPAVEEAIKKAKQALPSIDQAISLPADIKNTIELELFVRLLFSCLIDADFLDTEQHFSPDKAIQRGSSAPISNLWSQFDAYYREKTANAKPSVVNDVRRQIYQHCYQSAELAPGFFRLTAPTGGGKTLSSLAFALRHAKIHGKQRIIYAIPFTSIIDQTAKEFKEIFSDDVVLEHHSGVVPPDDPNSVSPSEVWRRLSAENWDSPMIITTSVQLFQSLFANSTSACRKLHNVAESVVVLDEVQLLPTRLLEPILDVLQQLVARYNVSVILCTATQPALGNRMNFQGLKGIRDIIPDEDILQIFASLSRVTYEWHTEEQWTWQQVISRAKQSKQAMIIVNTKKDAVDAVKAFDDPNVLHLSTSMCGLHRRAVLAEVKRRLADDEPCYLVSTQLIEAGVDVDFPLVMRALSPLDSIIQSGGRCNRNGLLPQKGIVIIFDPAESKGLQSYRTGISTLSGMLRIRTVDTEDPKTFQEYFQRFYSRMSLDEPSIQESRKSLKYETVSRDFKMIEDDTVPVVVRYNETKVDKILSDLQQSPYQAREIMRQLQPYMVSLRAKDIEDAKKRYPVSEHSSGVLEWIGGYDEIYGIVDGAIFA